MTKITTIGELREAIAEFNENDIVVVEIHEGIRGEDLYEFEIDTMTLSYVPREDGTLLTEVRLCI